MPAAFAVGPGYPLRFSEGRLGFVTRPLWMGQEDPVVCCGEGGISSVFSLSFRPGLFMTVGCGVAVSSPQILSFPLPASLKKGGMVRAVSPWYLVAWKTFFTVRNNFQETDLCFVSLSNIKCRVSSFCRLDPSELGLAFVRVCFRRCHCAPSMLRGPDGS